MQIGNLKKEDLPGFAMFMSILLVGVYAAIIYGGKWELREKHELYEVSGIVESFNVESVYRGGKNMMIQLNSHGVVHRLAQDDFTRSIPALKTLQQGDEIDTLVAPDELGRDLEWIWEIRREDQTLLSYEQTLELRKPNTLQWFIAIAALLAAIGLLIASIKLRIKYQAWTS